MRAFLLGKSSLPGALILPAHLRQRGWGNWPKCMRCKRAVDAYGLENETDKSIEIWARCDGVRVDPKTGDSIAFAPKVHETMKTSVTIQKGAAWSENRLRTILAGLAFFAPPGEGDRELRQTIGPDSVERRWGAG